MANVMEFIKAAKSGDLSIIQQYILEHQETGQWNGVNVVLKGETALSLAAFFGHYDVVKYLLESGAHPFASDTNALLYAVQEEHVEVAQIILDSYYVKNYTDRNSIDYSIIYHAFVSAVSFGNVQMVQCFLDHSKVELKFNGESSILERGLLSGKPEIVEALIKNGADISSYSGFIIPHESAIMSACILHFFSHHESKESMDVIKCLIKHGADLRLTSKHESLRDYVSRHDDKMGQMFDTIAGYQYSHKQFPFNADDELCILAHQNLISSLCICFKEKKDLSSLNAARNIAYEYNFVDFLNDEYYILFKEQLHTDEISEVHLGGEV